MKTKYYIDKKRLDKGVLAILLLVISNVFISNCFLFQFVANLNSINPILFSLKLLYFPYVFFSIFCLALIFGVWASDILFDDVKVYIKTECELA
jgi:hypothetical protein